MSRIDDEADRCSGGCAGTNSRKRVNVGAARGRNAGRTTPLITASDGLGVWLAQEAGQATIDVEVWTLTG